MEILDKWETIIKCFVMRTMSFDEAHDIEHIERVVKSAKRIGIKEGAEMHVVIPAAWLHDCINVDKESSKRNLGSKYSADAAIDFLKSISYPEEYYADIHHAIHAHSFSANVETETIEAKVVQDADRIDALGAIGLARCISYSAGKNRKLYCAKDPFAESRELNEKEYAIDHFYTKLLTLPKTMKTAYGKELAQERADFLQLFLDNLKKEIE